MSFAKQKKDLDEIEKGLKQIHEILRNMKHICDKKEDGPWLSVRTSILKMQGPIIPLRCRLQELRKFVNRERK